MWIVRLALRRPYTFVVMAILLMVSGGYVIARSPTDILPDVDIPVINIVWSYGGLPAQQMEQQITQFSEYAITGNVADIQKVVSETYDGTSVIHIYLQPDANVPTAIAQATAISQTIIRRMPPGTQPPVIVRYSASSVPIMQLAFSSDALSEAEIFDHVNQRVRTMLSVVQGTRFPLPMGGKARQISVDLDLDALKAHGLTPNEVNLAISAQNLVLPTGSAKMGDREYRISLNSSPEVIAALNDIPIRKSDGRTVYVRDVAQVHDGFALQTNLARHEGKRSVVLSVLKTGGASTTEVAQRIRDMLPTLRAAAPEGMSIQLLSDQSGFVTRAISGLLVEAILAALLTAAMILLFLGSARSTLIVAVSIPLSVVAALLMMRALGETVNVMTLGGLALAVGILVDDATVEIENIHRNLAMGKTLTRAILDGAKQIAVPAFVASTCISIVFVSVLFLQGPAKYIFRPMGLAVGFSVMFSYVLSRTLIPTMVRFLLRADDHEAASHGWFGRVHHAFNARFDRFRDAYVRLLGEALRSRGAVILAFTALVGGAVALTPFVGRDFFPKVDAGEIRLHVTAPPGTRLEETERWFSGVEAALRELIPASERQSILDQMGLPSGFTMAVTDTTTLGSSDGEILVSLVPHHKRSTEEYIRLLRTELAERFPELSFYFQPADIVTRILNFGLPSPIDVQVSGVKRDEAYAAARNLERELAAIRGTVDVHLHQVLSAPRLHLDIDRIRTNSVGLTERDVANNLLLVVSSSAQTSPAYWINPTTGLSYPVAVQVADYKVSSLDDLRLLAINGATGPQLLGDLTSMKRMTAPLTLNHLNVQPTYNVRADIQSIDLASVAEPLERAIQAQRKKLPPGVTITAGGQIDSMRQAFISLGIGLLFAALLVYALMVINFQSWLDPFIILMALPGAGVGIVCVLFATHTTFSIPSLMGAIMSIGVATANSILVVTFANEQRLEGKTALEAALEAGRVRLRPVVMTATAMLIGMLPMSLALGEGGEQNAALGRAVIGGLFGATLATLFLVPVVYSLLTERRKPTELDPELVVAGDAHVD